jgi:hypothetical protein
MVVVLIAGLTIALLAREFPRVVPFLLTYGIPLLEVTAGAAIVWFVAADVLPHMH